MTCKINHHVLYITLLCIRWVLVSMPMDKQVFLSKIAVVTSCKAIKYSVWPML